LLFTDSGELTGSGSLQSILVSIAHQCFNNEYVFSVDEKEKQEVESLAGAIEIELQSGQEISPELERNVLVVSMYTPLYKQSFARVLE